MKGYQELLLPAIKRISGRLERAAVAAEVADYLGLDHQLVLAEFRRIPGASRQVPGRAQPAAAAISIRDRVLLRSVVISKEVRDLLVPALHGSAAAKSWGIWSTLEVISALYEKNPAFDWEQLETIAGEEQKRLLGAVLLADKSGEVFTVEQARAFLGRLETEDLELRCKQIQQSLKEAERSGNLGLAIELIGEADELRKRISRSSPG